MKPAKTKRVLERREQLGRLLTEAEILDYIGISLPTWLAIEAKYKERGGTLRRITLGRKTIRYFEHEVMRLVAEAINEPYVLDPRSHKQLTEAAK